MGRMSISCRKPRVIPLVVHSIETKTKAGTTGSPLGYTTTLLNVSIICVSLSQGTVQDAFKYAVFSAIIYCKSIDISLAARRLAYSIPV